MPSKKVPSVPSRVPETKTLRPHQVDGRDSGSLGQNDLTFESTDALLEPDIKEKLALECVSSSLLKSRIVDLIEHYEGIPHQTLAMLDWASQFEVDLHPEVNKALKERMLMGWKWKAIDRKTSNLTKEAVDDLINGLLHVRELREGLLELIKRHPGSTFLQRALKVVTGSGFNTELSNPLEKFHLFMHILEQQLRAVYMSLPGDYADQMRALTTYAIKERKGFAVLAVLMKRFFSEEPSSPTLKILQVITGAVPQRSRGSAVKLLISMSSIPNDIRHHLSNVLAEESPNPTALTQIHTYYRDHPSAPFCTLLFPRLSALIVRDLYQDQSVRTHRNTYLWILARISSGNKPAATDDLYERLKTLDAFLSQAKQAKRWTRLGPVFAATKESILAVCFMAWLQDFMKDEAFLRTRLGKTPLAFCVLRHIARVHPVHRTRVLETLQAVFARSYPRLMDEGKLELRKILIGEMLRLCLLGSTRDVIHWLIATMGGFEDPVIEVLLENFFNLAKPPLANFVAEFVITLLNVAHQRGLTSSVVPRLKSLDLLDTDQGQYPVRVKQAFASFRQLLEDQPL